MIAEMGKAFEIAQIEEALGIDSGNAVIRNFIKLTIFSLSSIIFILKNCSVIETLNLIGNNFNSPFLSLKTITLMIMIFISMYTAVQMASITSKKYINITIN